MYAAWLGKPIWAPTPPSPPTNTPAQPTSLRGWESPSRHGPGDAASTGAEAAGARLAGHQLLGQLGRQSATHARHVRQVHGDAELVAGQLAVVVHVRQHPVTKETTVSKVSTKILPYRHRGGNNNNFPTVTNLAW